MYHYDVNDGSELENWHPSLSDLTPSSVQQKHDISHKKFQTDDAWLEVNIREWKYDMKVKDEDGMKTSN